MSAPSTSVPAPTQVASVPEQQAQDSPLPQRHAYNAGLLLLRVTVGLMIAAHGTQKLFGWFNGNGLDGTAQFFASAGYPSAKTMALIAALTETLGGLGLAIGLLTPLAGAAVFGTMINAIAVTWKGGLFRPMGFEYALVLGLAAAALTLTGPGQYAADRVLPVLRSHRLSYGAAAIVLGAVLAGLVLLTRS